MAPPCVMHSSPSGGSCRVTPLLACLGCAPSLPPLGVLGMGSGALLKWDWGGHGGGSRTSDAQLYLGSGGGSQWLSAVLFDDGGWLEQLHLSFCSLTWALCLSHFSRTPQGPPGFPALMEWVRSCSPGTWPLGALCVPWVLTSTQGLRTTSLLLGFQQPVLLMAQELGLVWSSQSWATTTGSQQGLHSWG